jgi:addiction module RelE/StbE family toxin
VSRVTWSPAALRDLESIRAYIQLDSTTYAELVVRRIVAAVERLAHFPESGRIVPELQMGDVREVIQRPFRIVYRVRPGEIEIATVFRSSRTFPGLPGPSTG